jgi:hypothetical protein
MTIIRNVIFGLLIGFLLLVCFAFLGMSIGSLLIGALIIGSVAFFIYLAFGMRGMKPPVWVSPIVSAICLFPAVAISGPAWTCCVVMMISVAGIAGAYAGIRLSRSNRASL